VKQVISELLKVWWDSPKRKSAYQTGAPAMSNFPFHSVESAPEASKKLLMGVEKMFGFIPSVLGALAEAPAALETYLTVNGLFDKTSFDVTERQVVLITANFYHNCEFCMAAHSAIAKMQGVPDVVIEALRNDTPLPTAKLEALRTFTRDVLDGRGWVDPAKTQAFYDAGYGQQQVLEVIMGIALKTVSNYTNHFAKTPVDEAFKPFAWKKSA